MVDLKLRTECDFQADHSDTTFIGNEKPAGVKQQHGPLGLALAASPSLSWLLEE